MHYTGWGTAIAFTAQTCRGSLTWHSHHAERHFLSMAAFGTFTLDVRAHECRRTIRITGCRSWNAIVSATLRTSMP